MKFKELFITQKSKQKKIKLLRENLIPNLIDAANLLESINFPYWLSDGTLLGLYRDGRLLDHDTDSDLGCYIRDYRDDLVLIFQQHNWKLKSVFGREKLGLQLSFIRNEAKIDLFFFYEEEGCFWHGAWRRDKKTKERNLIKYYYESFGLKKATYFGFAFNIPDDPVKYLETKYGPTWNVPQKEWDWAFGPSNAVATDIYLKPNKKNLVI